MLVLAMRRLLEDAFERCQRPVALREVFAELGS